MVALENRDNNDQVITVLEGFEIDKLPDHETQIRVLKKALLNTFSELDTIKFTGEGTLDISYPVAYVTGIHQDHVYNEIRSGFLLTFAADDHHLAIMQFMWIDTPEVPQEIVALMANIANHFQFSVYPSSDGT